MSTTDLTKSAQKLLWSMQFANGASGPLRGSNLGRLDFDALESRGLVSRTAGERYDRYTITDAGRAVAGSIR